MQSAHQSLYPLQPLSQDDDPHQRLVIEAIKDDTLRAIEQQKKAYAEHCILSTAKLISPAIEGNFAVGFDW